MLYLEDYLEMIEHLPSELRDRFTDMREVDLSVQNRVDSLEDRQKTFFGQCRRLKTTERDEEFEKIKKEYNKVIEDANEKVLIAEESYGLVDRYLRKLDQELHKFKMELEADNRGITEILEKHSLELDAPSNDNLKENKNNKKNVRKHHGTSARADRGSRHLISDNLSMDSMSTCSSSSANVAGLPPGLGASGQNMFAALQHLGVGANPIAAAASQAIAATQQLTGRRTSSLKASFGAINLGVQKHEFAIGRDYAGLPTGLNDGASSAMISGASGSGQLQKRKKSHGRSSSTNVMTPATPTLDLAGSSTGSGEVFLASADDLLGGAEGGTDPDWTYDPSEPRYCTCNQVSYGDMVACDNQECPYEWFHYACVGITAPPKGKWYCPTCLATMVRKKGRK